MALQYFQHELTIVVRQHGEALPANSNNVLATYAGEYINANITISALAGKRVLGSWWATPSYNGNFRDTFGHVPEDSLTVSTPDDGKVHISGHTATGARSDSRIVIHSLFESA